MKRIALKRKTGLKKKSKQSISKIQRSLWELCKQLTRKQYSNTCYTCDRTGLDGSNWHTGHLFAKASLGAYLKYDLRVLRPQCYHCNINLGGNGGVFYRRMVEREGQEYVDKIFADRNTTVKAIDHYISLSINYQNQLNNLEK